MSKKTFTSTSVVRFCAFVALILSAFFSLLDIFKDLGIFTLEGSLVGILDAIKGITLLIAIGLAAYDYVSSKKKAWKVVYWVCVGIIVVAILIGALNAFNVF